jgi:thiol-disulfide isomerase/thioredoxin
MNYLKRTGLLLCISAFTFSGPQVSIVSFDNLKQETLKNNDTLYVVNFWATWCDPCVKEIPFFQAAYSKFASRKVKMVFVSLNSAKELASVQKFAEQKQLKPEVLVLNAGNPNNWINAIDSSWSGALPATVLYRHSKKLYFHEGEFTQDKLNQIIQSKLK